MSGTGLARWWVSVYTCGLPAEVAEARRAELDSDIHEHLAAAGSGAAVAGRTLRGMAADVLWHVDERRVMSGTLDRPTGLRAAWATVMQSWFTPIAVLLALFN